MVGGTQAATEPREAEWEQDGGQKATQETRPLQAGGGGEHCQQNTEVRPVGKGCEQQTGAKNRANGLCPPLNFRKDWSQGGQG